jgi:predicted branched-subunit amino acid permease
MSRTSRTDAWKGVRHMLPIAIPAIPFGMIIGIATAESAVPNLAGFLSASLIFGGAAQLAAVSLLGAGAPALSALSAALIVNTRHAMYSAALVPRFRGQPRWFRRFGPYLLIDQVFALASTNHDDGPDEWRRYYLGAGIFAWVLWHGAVAAGILLGPVLPEGLDLSFTIPALFIGLLVPGLVRRPALLAAVCAAVVSAALWRIPNRGGILVGAAVGVAAGYVAEGDGG